MELGFGKEEARSIPEMIKHHYRGSRYSFGFPACPNLHDQDKILDLLDAKRIHVLLLGDEDQLWPEESTSAIVVHHPAAKYFGV